MELRCKAGDLAIIIGAMRKENIGKIVEVVSYVGCFGPSEIFNFEGVDRRMVEGGHVWQIRSPNKDISAGTLDNPVLVEYALALDHNLQPIRPDILDDDAEDESLDQQVTDENCAKQ